MKVAVIGAGLAGVTCAQVLSAAGLCVALFDKGARPGGRMSTRGVATALGEASFDYGAQYFTAHDNDFKAEVAGWERLGLAAPWPAAGDDAYVGTPAMRTLIAQTASGLNVLWASKVDGIVASGGSWRLAQDSDQHAGPFDIVVVAVPAEQAAPLLAPHAPAMADLASRTPSAPCWTVMAAFAQRLPIDTDVLRGEGTLRWAARNAAKPGRSGPESWVIQAGPDWSLAHLEEKAETLLPLILEAFAAQARIVAPAPLFAKAHRWRYAQSGSAANGVNWDAASGLGVCGDWLLGPRVECAWLSGRDLARAILATPKSTAAMR